MNKALHWHIKGVGFDAREIAHTAARRAGVPVGEWLNSVIADKARDLGVSAEDFSEDERLDALVARLAGVAESVQADEKCEQVREAAPRMRAAAGRPAGAQPVSQMSVDHEISERRGDSARPGRRLVDPATTPEEQSRRFADWDGELRLDQALELAQKRASADDERRSGERQRLTVAAIAKEVERLGRVNPADIEFDAGRRPTRREAGSAGRNESARPLRDAVGSVAERIEQLEHRITHRDSDLANRPIVAAIGRLEDRFEHLLRRNADGTRESARVEATFRDLDSRLREISQRLERTEHEIPARSLADIERIDSNLAAILARLDGGAADGDGDQDRTTAGSGRSGRRANRDAIADIAQRQVDLDQSETRRAGLLRGASYPSIREAQRGAPAGRDLDGAPQRPAADDRDLAAMASLQDAFARLTERMETRLDEAVRRRAPPNQDEDIGALKTGIAALGERLDAIKTQNDEDRAAKEDRDDIESLRREISALQLGLTKLAPQSAIATLEDAVRGLGGQIDESRREGVSDAVLAPLERLRQEVRQALAGQDLRTIVDGVEDQLRTIAGRIERIETRGVEIGEIGVLQEQVAEIRELMHAAAGHFQAGERIEIEIGELAARVEQLSETPARSAIRDLELAVNEIRTMLVEFSPEHALQDVSRLLGNLGKRMETLEEQLAAPTAMFDDFTRRIEQANSSLAERLIKAMPPAVDVGSLEQMIGGLSDKLDGMRHPSGDTQALEGLVRGLAAQIEEARLPSADAKILDTLETQVGRLAERLDRSDASLDAITSVERLVRDLFQQVDETRTAAIDAAETAARSAAQETLRVALVNPTIAGEEASIRATRVVEQVGQELSEFRKAQQVSEKRVHATLLALNDTLERMVDRMVADAATGRMAAPQALPAPAASPATTAAIDEQPTEAAERRRGDEVPAPPSRSVPEAARLTAAKTAEVKGAAPAKPAPPVEIGRPTMGEPMPDVSPLIAAARRAAQAAQASAVAANREAEKVKKEEPAGKTRTTKTWRSLFRQRRRPVLLSVASVVLLLGALQIVRMSESDQDTAAVEADNTLADVTPAPVTSAPEPSTRAAAAIVPQPSPVVPPPSIASATTTPTVQTPVSALNDAAPKLENTIPPPSSLAAADQAPKGIPAGLRDLADRSDAVAQYEVGARLAEGRGLARDPKAAANWFERAALQGHGPAQYRLGSIYEKGNGVQTDAGKAIQWYKKAADQGNVRAMHNLAVMAAEGGSGKPDYAQASFWFKKAAEHGVRDSQYNLAILYARGLGVTQDLAQSYTWFAIAAAQGDADAGRKRDDVAAKLDSGKLAAAKSAADSFKPELADQAANEVTPPPGGWDVASPAKGLSVPKVSSM